ncbi:hypothetical protein BCR36DRAFT_411252 [Piromyces finnis]|uniref:Dickkopf N-terminal cysteine-rich domain-containing protein n=1 Tax=Piromyces finnis TaxID=1754191 RepID=A0A1Y1VCH7_9FUNG|nr:hypothetical protein BCR36DRAFT_411252 [Piromyces finnis]|eukprot:ORX52887.1 hypothetical protein BCR36DRAFT_411252 [Piromyces finnis]
MKNFTGIFSFEEAKQTYQNNNNVCKILSYSVDTCPEPLICYLGDCYLNFKCNKNDLTKCSLKPTLECQTNDDCLFNQCQNHQCLITDKYIECLSGNGKTYCGNEIGQSCHTNKDCIYENCKDNICIYPEVLDKKMILFPGIVFLVAFVILILLCCCCCICIAIKKNRKKEKC